MTEAPLEAFNADCAKAYAHFAQGATEEALLRVRRAGEKAVELIIRTQWPQARADRELQGTQGWERLRIVERNQLAPAVVLSNLHVLRTHGNIGVHAHAGTRELNTAFSALRALIGHVYDELLKRPLPHVLQQAMDQADPGRKLELERAALLAKSEEQQLAERTRKEAERTHEEAEKQQRKSEQEATKARLAEVEQQIAQLRDAREQAAEAAKIVPVAVVEAATEIHAPAPVENSGTRRFLVMAGLLLAVVGAVIYFNHNAEKPAVETTLTPIDPQILRVRILPFSILQDDPNVRLNFEEALRARFAERAQQLKLPVIIDISDTAARFTPADMLKLASDRNIDLLLGGELYEPTSVDSGRVVLQYVLQRVIDREQEKKDGLLFRTLADSGGVRVMATAVALFDRALANNLARRGRNSEALAVLYASKSVDPEEDQQQTYFRATLHFDKKDYATALRECQRLLDRTPNDAYLLAYMGKILLANGDFSAANERLDKSIAMDPNNVEALLDKVRVLMHNEPYTTADLLRIEEFSARALALDSTNARAWQYNADVAQVNHQWGRALYCAKRSVTLDNSKMEARNLLASLLIDNFNRLDTAVIVLKAILRDDPNNTVALTSLGYLYAEAGLGPPEEAEIMFKKARELAPNAAYVTAGGLGAAAEAKGDPAEALRQYQIAWAINSEDARVCFRIGKLLLEAGEYEQARDQLLLCLPKDSMDHGMNMALGICYSVHGTAATDPIKAKFHLERALLSDPSDPMNLQKLGDVLWRQGDLKGARLRYEQLLALAPDDYQANKNLADLLTRSGDRSIIIPYYRAMLKIKPKDPARLSNLAVMLIEQDPRNNAEALSLLNRSLALDPNDASSHNSKANVLFSMRDYKGAFENYLRAVALDSTFKQPDFEAGLKSHGY